MMKLVAVAAAVDDVAVEGDDVVEVESKDLMQQLQQVVAAVELLKGEMQLQQKWLLVELQQLVAAAVAVVVVVAVEEGPIAEALLSKIAKFEKKKQYWRFF
uniref:Uncharacterized protein n=1 Tax=Panagrolaimus sp. ES5 TaxID=591445 RepID=A0AC34F7R0_9BILA